jgi:hypothetical protein
MAIEFGTLRSEIDPDCSEVAGALSITRRLGQTDSLHILLSRQGTIWVVTRSAVQVQRVSKHPSMPVARAIASGSRSRPLV